MSLIFNDTQKSTKISVLIDQNLILYRKCLFYYILKKRIFIFYKKSAVKFKINILMIMLNMALAV